MKYLSCLLITGALIGCGPEVDLQSLMDTATVECDAQICLGTLEGVESVFIVNDQGIVEGDAIIGGWHYSLDGLKL